ncbi:MAG: RNA polymerase sigma factor [Bacteroidales bacterium]|nr:RNA polymerase sigma factor [Bacteroidales bacterium]
MTTSEFNTCVDLHSDGIYRFILKNMRDEDEAKDVIQDAFEKIWIKHEEISFEKAKSYFFSSAYHTMIDRLRKKNKQVKYDEEINHESMLHSKQYSDLKQVLDEAIKKLPEAQRSALLLRDYEGYSYEEIGEITGLNESQVKVYIYRARIFLKDYLVSIDTVL